MHSLSPDPTVSLQKLDRSFGLNLKSDDVYLVPEIFFDMKNRFFDLKLNLVILLQ